jgi:N-acetylglucosamine malate deacetylase 2
VSHWVIAGVSGSPALRYAPAADSRPQAGLIPAPPARGPLPRARHVLAVIARPGQESADLGALLHAFRRTGARLALLSVTRGEASPLNSTWERLETRRPWELQVAAAVLGICSLSVADYPDGGLARLPLAELTELVQREIRRHAPDLLLVVDPVAASRGGAIPAGDDPDDAMLVSDDSDGAVVARAVRSAAEQAGLPVVARTTTPGTRGARQVDLGPDPAAARAAQRSAVAAYLSQSQALPEVERRLDLLDGRETLRWLVPAPRTQPPPPHLAPIPRREPPAPAASPPAPAASPLPELDHRHLSRDPVISGTNMSGLCPRNQ